MCASSGEGNAFHDAQHAMKGGAAVAIAKIAYRVEVSALNLQPGFAISVDFAKMFNNMNGVVAGQIARYMGLDDSLVDMLLAPITQSQSVWR